MSNDVRERLRRVLVGRLESLEQAGVRDLPKRKRSAAKLGPEPGLAPERGTTAVGAVANNETMDLRPGSSGIGATASLCPVSSPTVEPPTSRPSSGWQPTGANTILLAGSPQPLETSRAPSLDVLQQEVAPCTRCQELAATRTQTVFGVGNSEARLCFLGEAPGADEDRQGEPFVGRAGQLLNKIIEACRMKREDVYICNILKCRPPGNRNPLPAEAANCRSFLERQLELVAPEFICCLGTVAAQNLLGTQQSIGKLRGKVLAYRGAKVICTYHPAYLLRNPSAKKDTWDDMKLLMREMGVEL
jgi:DNA polymerase